MVFMCATLGRGALTKNIILVLLRLVRVDTTSKIYFMHDHDLGIARIYLDGAR